MGYNCCSGLWFIVRWRRRELNNFHRRHSPPLTTTTLAVAVWLKRFKLVTLFRDTGMGLEIEVGVKRALRFAEKPRGWEVLAYCTDPKLAYIILRIWWIIYKRALNLAKGVDELGIHSRSSFVNFCRALLDLARCVNVLVFGNHARNLTAVILISIRV